MTNYRCLIFDQENKVREFFDVEADNVAQALAQAQIRSSPSTPVIEVWSGGRFHGRVTFNQPSSIETFSNDRAAERHE
jgi:hypothetical protein